MYKNELCVLLNCTYPTLRNQIKKLLKKDAKAPFKYSEYIEFNKSRLPRRIYEYIINNLT